MLNGLTNAISAKLGTNKGWQLLADSDDPDSKTLLFEYQSKKSNADYMRPIVKIEVGARSEHWPVSDHIIHSYTKEALREKIHEPETKIRVLNAERTFWEKATILHQYVHLPPAKRIPPRISRHFYEIFRLLNSPIKKKALEELILLERVANHKSIYFASGWAKYGTARKGTLKLIPPTHILKELQKDYGQMESMIFREIPSWKLILKTIEQFEEEFNCVTR